jgi:ferredoxin
MRWKAGNIRYMFFITAVVLAMPIPLSIFSGGLLWTSPFLLLNSVLAVKDLVLLNGLGFLTLIIIFFRYRWICRYTCPLGVVCDWASKVNKKGKTVRSVFSKYFAVISFITALFAAPLFIVFDPFNIFHASFEGFRTGFGFSAILKASLLAAVIILNILYSNIWCRSICPLGGMQFLAFDIRKLFIRKAVSKISKTNTRRFLITGISGLAIGSVLPRITTFVYGKMIRPPGALPEPEMNLICARCGNCSGVCPTAIIKQSEDVSQIGRLLTPVVDFSDSYCLPECTLCGDVCPSGAITRFSRADKVHLFMASVKIDVDACWLQFQRDCDLCRYHCAYDAIEIKQTGEDPIALPVLVENKCVGCAACKIVCPAEAIVMNIQSKIDTQL